MYKGSTEPDFPLHIYEGEMAEKKKKKTNKETFYNKRAQKTWYLRDRFYNTWLAITKGIYTDPEKMISLSSDIEEMDILRSETCRIPRKPNSNGQIQIYPKPEMLRKFKIASPNLFDSLVMCFEDEEVIIEQQELEFAGWGQ